MGLDPKVVQKLPLGLNKKQVNFENLERGKTMKGKKGLWAKHQKKISKATWTLPNIKSTFTWQTSSFKTFCKKMKHMKQS